jgi:transposase
MDLTDRQWAVVARRLPRPRRRPDGKGRPRQDDRAILNGILWVLKTGAPWHALPERYPPYQTCHRRFQEWNRRQAWPRVLRALSRRLDFTEGASDATFAPAKKGGVRWGRRNAGKARK